ncbi:uncharacterized protein [Rhodnius prolixus]|uniref:uncharacterized protein n=1 Tax=Rhodnius prolixus TaxID=13249 RepID=UPI003D18F0A5
MFASIEEGVINDDIWTCMVVMLTEAYLEYESDVQIFKIFNGCRPVIEVITPRDVEMAFTEFKKRWNTKNQSSGVESGSKSTSKKGTNISNNSEEKTVKKSDSMSKRELNINSKDDDNPKRSRKKKKLVLSKANYGYDRLDAKTRISLGIKQHILSIREKELNQKEVTEAKSIEKSSKSKGRYKGSKEKISKLKIHDEPKCGPNKYFVLIGFYDNNIIAKLINLNVPLIGIICYGEDNVENILDKYEEESFLQDHNRIRLYQFWFDLLELTKSTRFRNELNDFAVMACIQPNFLKSTEGELSFHEKGSMIYNYLTRVLYELAKTYRKYIHYINTSNEISSPLSEKLLANEFIYYNQMMESVPLEYITVEYILHCLVEHTVSEEELLTETDLLSYETVSTECDRSSEPLIINNKNKIKKSSFNIVPDMNEISMNLYSHMPYSYLINYLNGDLYQSTKIKFQFNFLMKYLGENTGTEKFQLFIHQILFSQMYYAIHLSVDEIALEEEQEKLDYTLLNMENVTSFNEQLNKERTTTIADRQSLLDEIENPKVKREFDLFKLESFLNCKEITNLKHFFIEDNEFLLYMFVEDLKKCELLQSLQRALNKHTNMYFLPSLGTDSVLAFFHNDFNKYGLSSNDVEGSLRTAVGFRDYFLYVRKEISGWLLSQKEIIDAVNSDRKNTVLTVREDFKISEIAPYPCPNKVLGIDAAYCNNSGYNLYNVSDSYVSTKEKSTTFYSTDGVILNVKHSKWANLYSYLSIILKSFSATITYHYVTNDSDNLFSEEELHFNVSLKNGTIITCIQKLRNENPDLLVHEKNKIKPETSKLFPKIFMNEKSEAELTIINDEYNFDITLPTGLKIEVRYNRDYIKQYYLEGSKTAKEIEDEECRNYIRNGTVIIFYKNDIIHILYSNGSKVEINRVVKRTITIEEKLSELDMEKVNHLPVKAKHHNKRSANEKGINKEGVRITEKEIYNPVEIKIFGWAGQYVHIMFDIIFDFSYLHKMRIAQDKNQVIIKKTDGTSSLYTDEGALSVTYPNGIIIVSEIIEEDTTFITADEEETDKPNDQDDLEVKDFQKILTTYIIPSYKKLHSGVTMDGINALENFFLTSLNQSTFSKVKTPDEEENKLENNKDLLNKTTLDKLEESTKTQKQISKNVEKKKGGNISKNLSLFENLKIKYCVHHPLFANIKFKDNDENWIIELPDDTSIITGKRSSSIITDNTSIIVRKQEVKIFSNKSKTDQRITLSSINLRKNFIDPTDIWITEDSKGRSFLVNSEGKMRYFVNEEDEPQTFSPIQTKLYNRFYVIRPDLSGYEFIHLRDNRSALSKYDEIKENESKTQRYSCSNIYSINSYKIFKNKSELYKTRLENPVKNSNITLQDFGEYFSQPKNWIFDVPILQSTGEKMPIESIKKPLVVIYRKVKDVSIDYQSYYEKLVKAIAKIGSIKQYLYERFDNNTIFCKQKKTRKRLVRDYKEILGFIGAVNFTPENKDK